MEISEKGEKTIVDNIDLILNLIDGSIDISKLSKEKDYQLTVMG